MEKVKYFDKKKFMWDGVTHDSEPEALQVKAAYEKENFEIFVVQEEGKHFVFTRRLVAEVEVVN